MKETICVLAITLMCALAIHSNWMWWFLRPSPIRRKANTSKLKFYFDVFVQSDNNLFHCGIISRTQFNMAHRQTLAIALAKNFVWILAMAWMCVSVCLGAVCWLLKLSIFVVYRQWPYTKRKPDKWTKALHEHWTARRRFFFDWNAIYDSLIQLHAWKIVFISFQYFNFINNSKKKLEIRSKPPQKLKDLRQMEMSGMDFIFRWFVRIKWRIHQNRIKTRWIWKYIRKLWRDATIKSSRSPT